MNVYFGLEMVVLSQMEHDTLDSIFIELGEETITAWDLLYRLQQQLSEKKDRIEALESMVNVYKNLSDKAEAGIRQQRIKLDDARDISLQIAKQIALHGSADHKLKNEASLRHVARLLVMAENCQPPEATNDDDDDVPF